MEAFKRRKASPEPEINPLVAAIAEITRRNSQNIPSSDDTTVVGETSEDIEQTKGSESEEEEEIEGFTDTGSSNGVDQLLSSDNNVAANPRKHARDSDSDDLDDGARSQKRARGEGSDLANEDNQVIDLTNEDDEDEVVDRTNDNEYEVIDLTNNDDEED
ncbi:hypothetical protein V5O48_014830 [Marasmius crinis-equi]|uniref:Uncharacterized protein n=1 Tax=Marasmius crinis-equi TaxID=585013 RepID=A0ABR3EW92_9AGAR